MSFICVDKTIGLSFCQISPQMQQRAGDAHDLIHLNSLVESESAFLIVSKTENISRDVQISIQSSYVMIFYVSVLGFSSRGILQLSSQAAVCPCLRFRTMRLLQL